jgi:hypothetical protein
MGWRDEQRARDEAVLEELRRVRAAMEDLRPAVASSEPPKPEGGDLRRFPGLMLSVRVCRDYAAGKTLLGMLKPVPREHRVGRFGLTVNCLCGATVEVHGFLEPCPGSCGRWFVGDESGVWAVMLPEQEPDEARDAA